MSAESAPMLQVSDLRTEIATRAGVVHAVNGVGFDIPAGKIVGVVGESGCGKSATIRSLLGLLPPNGQVVEGSAVFEGRDLVTMPSKELRRLRGDAIAFVAQNPFGALNPILTIAEQFHQVMRAHRKGVNRRTSRAAATEMLTAVGINGPERVLDGHAHELSGGMAQRVVIAIAMILHPRLIIADEPTTALDVTIQRQILDLMRELVLADGRSMLIVTHDLGVVAQYCDEVVVMYAGKVVERGSAAQLFAAPAHPYTQALIRSVPRRGHAIEVLRGRVPDLVAYPQGCPFASRCVHVHERCHVEAPVLIPLGGSDLSRSASCHLIEEEAAPHVGRKS